MISDGIPTEKLLESLACRRIALKSMLEIVKPSVIAPDIPLELDFSMIFI